MTDREKVLKGLECCADAMNDTCPYECPYWDECRPNNFYSPAMRDAVKLLKEQPKQKHGHWVSVPDKSPKTTTINMYSFICSCSECGKAVGHHAEYNYCPGCGAIMTWMVNQDES